MNQHPSSPRNRAKVPCPNKPVSDMDRKISVVSARRSRGFTLTELLVVIAIIATLAAIGTVGYSKMQNSSHDAVCRGNLRQLGVIIQLYAADNGDKILPPMISSPNIFWDSALAEYSQTKNAPNVWRCPADRVKRKGDKKWPGDPGYTAPPRSYIANAFVFNLWGIHAAYPSQPPNTAAVLNSIQSRAGNSWNPSKMWVLSEVHQEETGGDLVMGEHNGSVMGGPPKATHRNNVNALMLDGSVISRPPGTDKWWGIGK